MRLSCLVLKRKRFACSFRQWRTEKRREKDKTEVKGRGERGKKRGNRKECRKKLKDAEGKKTSQFGGGGKK